MFNLTSPIPKVAPGQLISAFHSSPVFSAFQELSMIVLETIHLDFPTLYLKDQLLAYHRYDL
jgi:hypothetical protein